MLRRRNRLKSTDSCFIQHTTMKLASALILSALAIAGTQAAPTAGHPFHCHKKVRGDSEVGRPYYAKNTDHKTFLAFSKEHGGQLAKAPNGSVDKLAFYQCDAVPHYDSRDVGRRSAGQVRRAKDPSMCLTISGIDNRARGKGYDPNNGYLTLKPCAKTTKDQYAENQWFDRYGDKLRFRGKNSDKIRDSVHFRGGSVYLVSDPEHDVGLWLETLDD